MAFQIIDDHEVLYRIPFPNKDKEVMVSNVKTDRYCCLATITVANEFRDGLPEKVKTEYADRLGKNRTFVGFIEKSTALDLNEIVSTGYVMPSSDNLFNLRYKIRQVELK